MTRPDEPMVIRFNPWRRIEHFAVMASFILLVLTGLPQRYHDAGWAERLIGAFGGIDATRVIHRATGIFFAVVAVIHLGVNILLIFAGRMRMEMAPTLKDFRDTIQSVRCAFDPRAEEPRFGRYDFRQKFEYWGMIVGALVMIATGFILYFPVATSAILPGQWIAAAKVAHSNEAMLALLVVIVWHMYCAHLKPGYFPVDTSIFTGKISAKRMREEHPLEMQKSKGGQ